ncbi:MAG: HAMP domain-containing protein [Gammaproteobacteria bacterium]|nr:HAMP domain-containing protein [Gammaproteobacteria bacterium]
MRLHSNIFLWIFFATVLPLSALALAVTYLAQDRYEEEVNRGVHSQQQNLAAELRRHFDNQREMLISLAESGEFQVFQPILSSISSGELPRQYDAHYHRLAVFLRSFSNIRTDLHTLRVMDISGNTLMKIRQGRSYDDVIENFSGLPYVEEEVLSDEYRQQLESIQADTVVDMVLHQRQDNMEFERIMPLLDHVLAVTLDGERVGYISVSYEGEAVDRIIDYASRIHDGQLSLVELNSDNNIRHGMIIYSDDGHKRLSQVRYRADYLQSLREGRIWSEIEGQTDGHIHLDHGMGSYHYFEFQPYRESLVSWLLLLELDAERVSRPFEQIRSGIWSLVGLALLISLLITRIGSRHIAQPVCQLATNLKQYADGKSDLRVSPKGAQEIQQLGSSFNYMADTLALEREERNKAERMMLQNAKLASVGQLAAGIGHEINNPLNNILSYAKLVERQIEAGQEGVRRDLASLREEALRASEIVHGILNFSRQLPGEYHHFAASDWLEQSITLIHSQTEKKGISVNTQCEEIQLYGDRGQLQQVLINLLINACHATDPGGEVRVLIERQQQHDLIAVVDSGHGIDAEDMEHIFDPFYSTKKIGEGSGLGLSISLGIVEQHGGKIEIENNADHGATVKVMLPHQPGRED